MAVKLDMKDKRILYELDVNSRQPNSEIAKKVRLSKQVVGNRIKTLIDNQVLASFYPVIDVSKLGFTVHKNFLRLQNIDRKTEFNLIEFLKKHPDVVWVASCDGFYDLAFGTWARDMAYLDKTITDLNKNFGQHILERQIATIIKGEYFVRDYLIDKKEPSALRKSFFGSIPEEVKIDEYDWKILNTLSLSARKTAIDISKEVNLSSDAVIDRIKKLENSGIVKSYNIVPNESNFPYLHYKLLISFRNFSEEREKSFSDYCRFNPNIVYIVKSLGPWNFEIDLEVENNEKFREILMDIKTKFSDMLKDYFNLQIYQVHKYNFCPSNKFSS